MLKKMPKIIFFDIDETLYIKSEKRIPDSIRNEVLPRLKAKGIIPAIATGRCVGAFPEALAPLLNADGFELLVTINGQHNSYRGSCLSHYPLETQRIEQVLETLNHLGIAYGLVADQAVAVSEENAKVRQSLTPITADYQLAPTLYQHQPIYQLLAFFDASEQQRVVASGVLQSDLKIVRWHELAVDLLHTDHSKAMGIYDVLTHFGWDWSDAMAFGDGLNDIEMLSTVGFGVAMGNAEEEVKAVADYVTAPIEQDGILKALEYLGVI